MVKLKKMSLGIVLLGAGLFLFTQCSKDDKSELLTGTSVEGPADINLNDGWKVDKSHSNIGWETKYYDYSMTMLTGRFNNFMATELVFNEKDLSKCKLNAWVQLSTFNTGEAGRDGAGKCGPSFLGVTYTDSARTVRDPASDTAWIKSTSFERSGNGYIVKCDFTFNRNRPDNSRITKPVVMYLKFEGVEQFDKDGVPDRLRAGLTGHFTFKRSDHMDKNATKEFNPMNPSDPATAGNKTYGVYNTSTGDEMKVKINFQTFKQF
jgi:polyisoprenoid-binding protein YceI